MTSLHKKHLHRARRLLTQLQSILTATLMSLLVAQTPFLLSMSALTTLSVIGNAHAAIIIRPGECYEISNGILQPVPCPATTEPTCSVTGGNFSVDAGTIVIPRNRPNGSVLKTISQTTRYVVTCKGASDRDRTVNLVFAVQPTQASAPYQTGSAGVGIRYKISEPGCSPGGQSNISNGKLIVQCNVTRNQTLTWSFSTTADLIKTGTIAFGDLSTKPRVTVNHYFDGQAESTAKPLTDLYSDVLTGRISAQTCQVTSTNVVIPLTPASGLSTRIFTGVGSGSNWTSDVPILLDCTGVTANVYMTVTDATNNANTSSFLSLTPSSSATGVAIELSVSGTPKMSFGPDSSTVGNLNQFRIDNANGSSARVNLSARYVQRSARVSSGTANGAATFTMAYQ